MLTPTILHPHPFTYADLDIQPQIASSIQTPPHIEQEIAAIWQKRYSEALQQGQKIWEADLYRFEGLNGYNGQLTLHSSTIPFSYVHAFYHSPYFEIPDPAIHPFHMAIGALIATADQHFVFGQRAGNTLSRNAVDMIGGLLSASETPLTHSDHLRLALEREIAEEINVTPTYFTSNRGLGIVQSYSSNILLICHVQLNITSADVNALFCTQNDGEMQNLIYIPEAEVKEYLVSLGGYKPLVAELL